MRQEHWDKVVKWVLRYRVVLLSVTGVLVVLGAVLLVPDLRLPVLGYLRTVKQQYFAEGAEVEAESTSPTPEDSLPSKVAQLSLELSRLQQRVDANEGVFKKAQDNIVELQAQLKDSLKEVATLNDSLERQHRDWEASIKQVGSSGSVVSSSSISTAASSSSSGKVNINTATAAELDTLPGIGPSYAQKIIEYRESKGGFKEVKDLLKVSGIGDALLKKIEGLVTV